MRANGSRTELHIARVKRVAQLRKQGLTYKLIAERLGLAPSSIADLVKEAGMLSDPFDGRESEKDT